MQEQISSYTYKKQDLSRIIEVNGSSLTIDFYKNKG